MADIRQKILDENIKLHRIEAAHYDALHPEEFNWFEQARISRDISRITTLLPKPSTALDIGCGTGNVFLKLLAGGLDVCGVDISRDMVEALRARIPEELEGRARLSAQNIDDFLSACVQEFDLITACSVLHHLPDYMSTLELALRRLKPGGWLYITHEPTMNALGPDPFLRKVLWQVDSLAYDLLHRKTIPKTEARDYRMSDYHLYYGFDDEGVMTRCRSLGLDVVSFVRYSSAMRMGLSCWLDSRVLRSKRQFSLIARKKGSK
jgi:ubiquinone/menaquinone biosynthesis C-methylase UbiE